MLALLKEKFFYFLDGRAGDVDASDAYFFQLCVANAVWKDKAEAEGVLDRLIELASHESVTLGDADWVHKSLLSSIVTVAKAARQLEHPSE